LDKTYYSFKLNLSGRTIFQLKKENNLNLVLSQTLPVLLKSIINLEIAENNERHFFKFEIESEKLFDDKTKILYYKLSTMTEKLRTEYDRILLQNEKTGDVVYPKHFITLNEDCIRLRNSLERKISFIKLIYDDITDKEADIKLFKNKKSNVKTGRTHLLKFEKIKYYVEKSTIEIVDGFYEPQKEVFYLEKTNSFEETKMKANIIQKKINNDKDFNEKLGIISIIEQYEKIKISEDTKKIKFELVYPNPDLVRGLTNSGNEELNFELDDILENMGFDNFKGELSGGKLNVEETENQLNSSAGKGYLLSIDSSGVKKEYKETFF